MDSHKRERTCANRAGTGGGGREEERGREVLGSPPQKCFRLPTVPLVFSPAVVFHSMSPQEKPVIFITYYLHFFPPQNLLRLRILRN